MRAQDPWLPQGGDSASDRRPPPQRKGECFEHQVAKTGRPFAAATAASAGFAKAVSFRALAELRRGRTKRRWTCTGPAGLKAFGFAVSCTTQLRNLSTGLDSAQNRPTLWGRSLDAAAFRHFLEGSSALLR